MHPEQATRQHQAGWKYWSVGEQEGNVCMWHLRTCFNASWHTNCKVEEEGDGVWVISYPKDEMQMEKLNPLCRGCYKSQFLNTLRPLQCSDIQWWSRTVGISGEVSPFLWLKWKGGSLRSALSVGPVGSVLWCNMSVFITWCYLKWSTTFEIVVTN